MGHLLFAFLAVTLLASAAASAFTCPSSCNCYQTESNKRAATCTNFNSLHKHLITHKTIQLDVLRLKDASITTINGPLDKLKDLKILDLSGNNLKKVKKLPKHLKQLSLSKNVLTAMDPFDLPNTLEELDLSGNHLEKLSYAFTRLGHLRILRLAGNPLSCSCETLQVRDWLLRKSIETDEVTCSVEFGDAIPWGKIKSTEVCPKSMKTQDFDELMQGDDPLGGDVFQGSGSKPDDEYDDDVFMTVPTKSNNNESSTPVQDTHHVDEYDGSGDDGDFNFEDYVTSYDISAESTTENEISTEMSHVTEKSIETTTPQDDTEEDGSGSGGGILNIFSDDEDLPFFHSESTTTEESLISKSFGDFSNLINWFTGGGDDEKVDEEVVETTTPEQEILTSEAPVFDIDPVKEPEITKVHIPERETELIAKPNPTDTAKEEINTGNVLTAKDGDNSTTYACLGVLSFLLLLLVIFVIFKKRKTDKRRKRQQKRDAENPGIEFRDMNKKLMEKNDSKPKTNGNFETVPLVSNGDRKNHCEPKIIPATVHNNGDSRTEPVIAKPVQLPSMQSQPHANGKSLEKLLDDTLTKSDHPVNDADNVPRVHSPSHTPANRKSENDSECSPDLNPASDCKVRIKLKENPDSVPKTPVLVTRTRSNAGDIILTPVNKNGVTTVLR